MTGARTDEAAVAAYTRLEAAASNLMDYDLAKDERAEVLEAEWQHHSHNLTLPPHERTEFPNAERLGKLRFGADDLPDATD
ncbi:hypothetical protein CMK11_02785 [Candidatus Poribacteria bacterium]|nr:hypothetical protein [Candidatus Poribacteria bacterium]